jgi:hypothetical protein
MDDDAINDLRPVHRGSGHFGPRLYFGRNIRTTHEFPPIPIRSMDWSAVDDDSYDGEGSPIGRGATEAEAVADLIEQIEDKAP